MGRRISRIRHTLLVVALTGVLAACGDGSGGLPDAGLIMRDAAIASRHMKSAHIVLTATGSVPGFPFQRLEAEVTTGGSEVSGAATTMLGQVISFVQRDGALYGREPDGTLRPLPAGTARPPGMLGPGGFARLLDDLRDPRTTERGEFEGTDAFRIQAEVPAETIAALLPTANTAATLSTWIRVRGVHVPLRTVLEFPGGGTLGIQVARSTTPANTTTGQANPK
ncbi:LppX_LprAFG lipoprotein [Nocardia huaxiensis]|uniref:LppX_LprAFG lipoprotein n=1 Tax=Nocardia huaxiensis TaxID=2755382 RepID=UPI001E331E4F|nr:LppX_LprAFG lipoprotein [Nocardia huaxiensis]UFS95620.1 LppX_LprAFG lipoprotein [Nocardia huaxiensis]